MSIKDKQIRRTLTIQTTNVFENDEAWNDYKNVMINQLGSLVNFEELETTGKFGIQNSARDGSAKSRYILEVEDQSNE